MRLRLLKKLQQFLKLPSKWSYPVNSLYSSFAKIFKSVFLFLRCKPKPVKTLLNKTWTSSISRIIVFERHSRLRISFDKTGPFHSRLHSLTSREGSWAVVGVRVAPACFSCDFNDIWIACYPSDSSVRKQLYSSCCCCLVYSLLSSLNSVFLVASGES